jgi:hypothetical protein
LVFVEAKQSSFQKRPWRRQPHKRRNHQHPFFSKENMYVSSTPDVFSITHKVWRDLFFGRGRESLNLWVKPHPMDVLISISVQIFRNSEKFSERAAGELFSRVGILSQVRYKSTRASDPWPDIIFACPTIWMDFSLLYRRIKYVVEAQCIGFSIFSFCLCCL